MSTEPVREQLIRLALSLIERTIAQEIVWEERTNFGQSQFFVNAGKHGVIVGQELPEDVNTFYMVISTHAGIQVASLSLTENDRSYHVLRELFETAMFSARGGEEAIDEIMTFLDQRAVAS
ncbi:MAG: hypothetical protein CMM42_18085 [Rhodospirillaceae bacterium]|nr:hypothetical protein [Rhodospirillaceae bacterium]|tara:strand:- start:52 stop:414 length:363 start_codon:yes stop_codon:yes gene_type:complete